jgi:hypothetical protein
VHRGRIGERARFPTRTDKDMMTVLAHVVR